MHWQVYVRYVIYGVKKYRELLYIDRNISDQITLLIPNTPTYRHRRKGDQWCQLPVEDLEDDDLNVSAIGDSRSQLKNSSTTIHLRTLNLEGA
jgi:hypothetical protein